MYVLDKLWRGKLSPHEQCFNYGSEYNTLYQAMNAKATEIAACLSEEGKAAFQEYQAIREQMSAISEGLRLNAVFCRNNQNRSVKNGKGAIDLR